MTSPPNPAEALARRLHGFMKGSVIMPDGFDLTAPVLCETLNADRGVLWDGDAVAEVGAPSPPGHLWIAPILTTSKSDPLTCPSSPTRALLFQRSSGAPDMYQGEPLSATNMP